MELSDLVQRLQATEARARTSQRLTITVSILVGAALLLGGGVPQTRPPLKTSAVVIEDDEGRERARLGMLINDQVGLVLWSPENGAGLEITAGSGEKAGIHLFGNDTNMSMGIGSDGLGQLVLSRDSVIELRITSDGKPYLILKDSQSGTSTVIQIARDWSPPR